MVYSREISRSGAVVRRCFAPLLLGLLFAATAISVQAQERNPLPVVGLLMTHPLITDPLVELLRTCLRQYGYEDGRNIKVEMRSALGRLDELSRVAEQLVDLRPDVVLVVNEIAVRAMKQATGTIPIVMVGYSTSDPVAMGLIKSYSHPGGNVTGLFSLDSELLASRLEILREALPHVSRVAVLWDPAFGRRHLDEVQRSAPPLGLHIRPIEVRKGEDLEPAFRAAKQKGAGALIMTFLTMVLAAASPHRGAHIAGEAADSERVLPDR